MEDKGYEASIYKYNIIPFRLQILSKCLKKYCCKIRATEKTSWWC
jgi:hypothetical protein